MEDMAIPQPTTLDQLGKMYSSYFRPDDVRVLATTTNCKERHKENKEMHIKYNCCFIIFIFQIYLFFLHSIEALLFAKVLNFSPYGHF